MQSGAGELKHLVLAIGLALWGSYLPGQSKLTLVQTSNVVWKLPHAWFGGFSGIETNDNGETLYLLSDRGTLAQARLFREHDKITSIQLLSQVTLRNANGAPLQGAFRDAEGLAIASDGRAFVSFEFRHRVARLNLITGRTTRLPDHADFADFSTNSGLEALAIHPDGRLFTLAESRASVPDKLPLYAFDHGAWRIVDNLEASGGFRPVGADIDSHGYLYLLERAITPLGFRSQIRRFDLNRTPAPSVTLLSSLPATYDNLESLSVWQDSNGRTRLTLISDDNFFSLQATQIVEFLLTE
ncbi:esterase-like activity of phytase family protein [Sulfitobacter sp. F26204]|uniref:esterase-like activity of phytase family protein n=1 Tax=Sulfitobacter sp. F26204 TaxID=2996014 RepID=UPI00225E5C51|nr:esterase-like activity of phytase family protein [Sulfitobacter sp. F26204]MCX7558098.1 esterase-like activity of phytase family protein [Sulfitobacter sp. F26204]